MDNIKIQLLTLRKERNTVSFFKEISRRKPLLDSIIKSTPHLLSPTLAERVYCVINDVTSTPICFCGKPVNFINGTKGYGKTCSYNCMGIDKRVLSLDEYKKTLEPLNLKCDGIIDVSTPVIHECLICGYTFKKRPFTAKKQQACKKCQDLKLTKSHDEYVKQISNKFPEITVLGTYKTAKTKILHKHECGYEWLSKPNDILNGYNCPTCNTGLYRSGKSRPTKYGITFDSWIEMRCADVLIERYGKDDIEFKKRYNNIDYRTCDFYIVSKDLWIEVSNFNFEKYLQKIFDKRKMVNKFVFAYNELNLTEMLNELQY